MTQELTDLRHSILEGRYAEALAIVDELAGMSKQAILRNIESFLVRVIINLIKNQVEQRLNNSWVASISDSIFEIKSLNIKDNKTSCYIKVDEWQPFLENAYVRAIRPASVEVRNGTYTPSQLSQILDKTQIIQAAKLLLNLTYDHSVETLLELIDDNLVTLPGGEDWKFGRHKTT